MIVSEFSKGELTARLQDTGLLIRTGPFVCRVRSRISEIAEAMSSLYGDFSVSEAEFADFDVSLVMERGPLRWLTPKAYLYLSGHPHRILGRFPPKSAPVFLEWGLNCAIYAQVNTALVVHAAVLERGGRAVLILGHSGAGKSTLCAALAMSGWRLLTDELGLVGLDEPLITPLARPVNLKNASIEVIQRFSPQARFGPVCQTERKGLACCMRPPVESVRQMDLPAAPAWVVFVDYREGVPLSVQSIPRADAFLDVARAAFNYESLGTTGFQGLCRLMDQVECRRLNYGSLPDAIAYFDSPAFLS